MYYDFTVARPTVQGKIIIKKKGDTSYVLYEYGRKYLPEKRYAIPERTIIGKVSEHDSNLMYPNERFQEYFPDVTLPEERPDAYRSCCLRIGSYLIIDKVLKEYHLKEMIGRRFGEDAGLILDLVAFMIVDEENAGQHYPDFAYSHPLFSENMRIYSDSKVSRLLSSVTKKQIMDFLNDWNKKRDHRQRIYISYDSTNKNCQAGDVYLAEFGRAKDEKGLQIFNLAVAFDKTNKVPLFYEEYPGSIADVSQFTYLVDKIREYQYKRIGFILDRGYFSRENIRYMDENKYSFIIMVKGCRRLVSSIVEETRNTFETDRECSIRAYRVYGKTVKRKLYEGDEHERYFHIYFNPSRQAAEREHLEQMLEKAKVYLDKCKGKDIHPGASYDKYFTLRYDSEGRFLCAEEKNEAIRKELELCGYFCIVTSEKMTAAEALIHYKGRDMSEKLFRADKSFIGSKSMRVHSTEAVSAKLFVEFVALIVRNRIYNLLKETMLKLESSPNYMAVPTALRELEKIEMVRRTNGQYRLDHAISKKQRTILSAFGISEEDVKNRAAEIGNLLSENRSLLNIHEEDDEDGTDEIPTVD